MLVGELNLNDVDDDKLFELLKVGSTNKKQGFILKGCILNLKCMFYLEGDARRFILLFCKLIGEKYSYFLLNEGKYAFPRF